MKLKHCFLIMLCHAFYLSHAQVGIGTEIPNESSILDIESTTQGILIPRMSTVERNGIASPAEGLQLFNTTTKSLDLFRNGSWNAFENSSLVHVYSLDDLPDPSGSAITLDSTKTYVFIGNVDIANNYILMNGASLRGFDRQRDKITSNVAGAILRDTNKDVLIKELGVAPASSATQAYNFIDDGTHICNISESVIEDVGITLGVGEISGFDNIILHKNFWNTTDGLKIGGTVGSFLSGFNIITGLTTGAGIELLDNLTADDVVLSNNYFSYTAQIGLKVNASTVVDNGRLTSNMFRDVGVALDGITSFEIEWDMMQNSDIPDSKAVSFVYFTENPTETIIPTEGIFIKVSGVTTSTKEQRFTATDNRITYNGRRLIQGKINGIISATSPANSSSYTLGIALNGTVNSLLTPITTLENLGNNQSFQLSLNSEIDLVNGDFIELFIRSNNGTNDIIISDLQLNVSD